MIDSTVTYEYVANRPDRERSRLASLVIHAPAAPLFVPLTTAAIVVGRQPPSDVRVDDPSLSRQHARFTLTEDSVLVEDLGSTNGTRLDGRAIDRGLARPGQTVEIGAIDVTLHVRRHVAEAPPPSRTPRSAAMRDLDHWITRAASARSPVLIHGETGTGKERVAYALHARGPRAARAFRVVNCAAIPDTLAESLLFGHERGAFTGANSSQAGLFEQARGGTLFLDEIGELPLRIQAMLLRVLETKYVCRIGASREVSVDTRVVAATHRDLDAMVHAGEFREDLLYRLDALTLRVPPLRERVEEIVPLAREFLSEVGQEWNCLANGFSDAALEALEAYSWPGNVRQLRNVVERSLLVRRGPLIELLDLPGALRKAGPIVSEPERLRVEPTAPSASGWTFKEQVQAFESRLIEAALSQSGGNQRAASRDLGIPLRTLANKMKAYGLRASNDDDR